MAAVLLVEGKDDRHVIYSLLNHHQVAENFTVKDVEGKDKLIQAFRASLRIRDSQVLGIVIDADEDLFARWQSLRNILIETGYHSVPANPTASGLVMTSDNLPTVGIWIMPNNQVPRMLEDFIRFLVPAGDTLWSRAEQAVSDIPPQQVLFKPSYRSKAIVHSWLAWQEEPGKPLGQAITAKYLEANADYAQKFVAWLRRLFG
jgi:hypothetical protein